MEKGGEQRLLYGDALLALLLAVILASAWTLGDWHHLSTLRLPMATI